MKSQSFQNKEMWNGFFGYFETLKVEISVVLDLKIKIILIPVVDPSRIQVDVKTCRMDGTYLIILLS